MRKSCKGKSSVWNHHLAVPYHTLEDDTTLAAVPPPVPSPLGQLAFDTPAPVAPVLDNLIVEGDNLIALKALLPQYGGQVKCIYIDPPYNTGTQTWVYNDAVNSPLIQAWFDSVVGGQDLTRHDKWLCMMVPRLRLLRDLLTPDGVLFLSCDDNEQAYATAVLTEIFGDGNHVGTIIWKNVTDNNPTQVTTEHEYIICFALNKAALPKEWKSPLSAVKEQIIAVGKQLITQFPEESQIDQLKEAYKRWHSVSKDFLAAMNEYKFIDHGGVYAGSRRVHNPGQQGYRYDVIHPNGRVCTPPLMGYRYPPDTLNRIRNEGRILFGEDERKIIQIKVYAHEYQDKLPSVIDRDGRAGTNQLRDLFPEALKVFDYPKPVDLIKQLLSYVTSDDDIILDSFAGSGTTGQAVLELNQQDGGRRRFVLVQIPWETKEQRTAGTVLTREITAERVRRAIARDGHPAGFRYARVGQPLDADTLLGGALPSFDVFARYCYYLATSRQLPADAPSPDPATGRVGAAPGAGGRVIYLVYQPDEAILTRLALTLDEAERIHLAEPERRVVVYAPACFVDEDVLHDWKIDFVGIPYQLFERPTA